MQAITKLSFGVILTIGFLVTSPCAAVAGNMIYTQTNTAGGNFLAAVHQDPSTGKIELTELVPTGGTGLPPKRAFSQDSIVRAGEFLLLTNAGSNDISVFRLTENSARLVGPPTSSGGVTPMTLAVYGHIVYVGNQGDGVSVPANYTGFTLTSDGQLVPIPGSTMELKVGALPGDLIFADDGRLLLGARFGDNVIETFGVSDSGYLTSLHVLTGQMGAFGLRFNPVNKDELVGALGFLPGSVTYRMNVNDGVVAPLSILPDPISVDACWQVMSNDGRRAWFSGPRGQGITLNEIDRSGNLTRVSKHDTSQAGIFPTDMVADPQQHFLYVLMAGSGKILATQITDDSAEADLTEIQTIDLPNGSLPLGLVFVEGER